MADRIADESEIRRGNSSYRILGNDATDIRATLMKVPGLSTDPTAEKSIASVGK